MVADRGSNRQAGECAGGKIARILLFLGLAGLVDLIACGDYEIQPRILLKRNVQRAVPGKAVVARGGVGSAAVRGQRFAVLRLPLEAPICGSPTYRICALSKSPVL